LMEGKIQNKENVVFVLGKEQIEETDEWRSKGNYLTIGQAKTKLVEGDTVNIGENKIAIRNVVLTDFNSQDKRVIEGIRDIVGQMPPPAKEFMNFVASKRAVVTEYMNRIMVQDFLDYKNKAQRMYPRPNGLFESFVIMLSNMGMNKGEILQVVEYYDRKARNPKIVEVQVKNRQLISLTEYLEKYIRYTKDVRSAPDIKAVIPDEVDLSEFEDPWKIVVYIMLKAGVSIITIDDRGPYSTSGPLYDFDDFRIIVKGDYEYFRIL